MAKKKLKLNEEKTECLIIGTKHDTTKYDDLKEVSINNRGIILSRSVRDLGFVIDNNLTCNEQIQTVIKNANFSLRNIAFIKKYLDVDSMKKRVHDYIITRLDYCNSVEKFVTVGRSFVSSAILCSVTLADARYIT